MLSSRQNGVWRLHNNPSARESIEAWLENQKEYWSRLSPTYNTLYQDAWSRAEDMQTAAELAMALPLDSGSVLDLGCGTGLGADLIQGSLGRQDIHYTGADVSPEMIAIATTLHPTCSFRVNAMEDCGVFDAESFDTVMLLNGAFSYASDANRTIECKFF